ncbi:MAG: hypothetical protein M3R07_04660 [Gemmatimonadota bacterium]|nr:hypothetical protein [Gemmatimonadota bacterium]
MPVKQMGQRQPSPAAAALRERLVAEWRHPDENATQPIILEERGGANQPLHVYVVWDAWADLSGIERSELIVEAFEERYGAQQALNVTVAMGLTMSEADRLGIAYQ